MQKGTIKRTVMICTWLIVVAVLIIIHWRVITRTGNQRSFKVRPLAQDYTVVYASPDPENIYCYSPGLTNTPEGRLVATLDLGGPGVEKLAGTKGIYDGGSWQGKIFTSDDRGRTWQYRADFPFLHARPFAAGGVLYVLGHCGDLMIMRSGDGGDSWLEPVRLTEGEDWHGAPGNVHYANGRVYLVMEKRVSHEIKAWGVGELAPVLMRGEIGNDLTRVESWSFASELSFRDAVDQAKLDYHGIPFYKSDDIQATELAPGREFAPMGWLEGNVVQFVDPDHYWHDVSGRTLHLWLRAHTGGTGYAAVAKVVEDDDGGITTTLENAPSGRKMLYIPCPGGHLKFHILYDEVSRLYWLVSSQAADSMTRPEKLSSQRYGLPNNERHRLQLHFSRNCIDWRFAGLVAAGPSPRESRHYPTMAISGEDLIILVRSGDSRAKSAHNTNLITCHTVQNFRDLAY